MKTTINNAGGNRALVCYLFDDGLGESARDIFDAAVGAVFQTRSINRVGGGVYDAEIDDRETFSNVILRSGDWTRKLTAGVLGGRDVLVGAFFYNEPEPQEEPELESEVKLEDLADEEPDEDEEEEEQPSIPQLVCDALQTAFIDGMIGASAFVIDPTTTEFELEVE